MTATHDGSTGALPGSSDGWSSIDWNKVRNAVRRLQMRISKAVREGRYGKAKALQWLLSHSHNAKLLAVKRVVTNKGKKTPGVDGVIWNTPEEKMQAVDSLRRNGYAPLPLRRVYIKKKSGELRPLGIPAMRDRAMQALYALALAPIAETTADLNSYGFRKHRCCADAIAQCLCCLGARDGPRWILEGDIHACFDEISHDWILQNIPMDKKMLLAWLKSGYADKGKLYPTTIGVPQGGIISPFLANMALDGLEKTIREAVPRQFKVNVIRYADDFIIIGISEELLIDEVIPAVEAFLQERALILSKEKTRIIRIDEGFDFLGYHLRKCGRSLLSPHLSPQ